VAKAFADITFTPSVKKAQEKYGARDINRRFEEAEDRGNILGADESEFIEARDSFYMASVNENGWPYVQHRGGPAGFLKVIDEQTIGFADFRGNRQYLSVGNLNADNRISLILMDYPNRRRIKLWGRTEIIHQEENPELMEKLEVPTYRARVERAFLIHIEAIEWNCPQHITPRYTQEEVDALLAPLGEENALLKAGQVNAEVKENLGDGVLPIAITGVRQLTPRVRGFEIRASDGGDLPKVDPGAHIKVPVLMESGEQVIRNYSICSDTSQRDHYEIAVLREDEGRGGSKGVHATYTLGQTLSCSEPENHFQLHEDNRPAVLIAGGIGITPLKAMAHRLKETDRPFHLHFAGRNFAEMAFLKELRKAFPGSSSFYGNAEKNRMDVSSILANAEENAVFYVCGPGGLIDAVRNQATELGIDPANVRFERFVTAPANSENKPVQLTLQRSKKVIDVPAEQSLLEAMLGAGIQAPYSCQAGDCKTCAVKVVAGEADHRDGVLSDDEKEQESLMCPCVSRAQGNAITLDI
jgi:ferredoxin-NADP reductase/predicted pyridoxine 5'-phosphate oxidase superfamily flavin-nucleotide-binding protein